ncbi:MAG TPA: hypothetical protein VNN75_10070 [Stellaceae bacterium]|nr:hypothetical protein [Stellaceae bacterium]
MPPTPPVPAWARLLGLGGVDEVEFYRALDWLGARQWMPGSSRVKPGHDDGTTAPGRRR